ncbi:eukaryotic aspartyl protease domain-containing protein [Ditylenchus destructor]|uniref:Eukaryotic aspartyl protease domain-containing protein n=1 Tax=Ditylenchus destructor TaxID=166010 RepID=A0AAD4MW91_9BILA|nr:eukaryotic aspartyl protease domain-containing protein [Ditylenchus destructor]
MFLTSIWLLLSAVPPIFTINSLYAPVGHLSVPNDLQIDQVMGPKNEEIELEKRIKRKVAEQSGSIELIYYHSQLIIGEIDVGTPTQKFIVQFNIYTPESWLISANATVYKASGFDAKKKYYSNVSSSYRDGEKYFQTDFGYVNGIIAKDNILIGVLTIPNVPFGVAENAGYWISYEPIDGVFGLSTADTESGVKSAIRTITEDLGTPIVSVYLNKSKVYNVNGTGLLTFGSEDTVNCVPEYVYAEYSNPPTWQIAAFSVSDSDGGLVELRNLSITVSDWGSWFVTSKNVTEMIAKLASAVYDKTTGNYNISCETSEDIKNKEIHFRIREDGGKITSRVGDFITKYDDQCILAIYASYNDYDCNWYFPASFVRTHCVAVDFSKNQMGFSDVRPELRNP